MSATPGRSAGKFPGRLWAAFAMLPVADAAFVFIACPILFYVRGVSATLHDPAHAAAVLAVLTAILAVLVTIVAGIPVVSSELREGTVSLRRLVRAGLILGNAPFATLLVCIVLPFGLLHLAQGTLRDHLASPSELASSTLILVAFGSAVGVWSALFLWVVGLRPLGGEDDRLL